MGVDGVPNKSAHKVLKKPSKRVLGIRIKAYVTAPNLGIATMAVPIARFVKGSSPRILFYK